MLRNRREMCGTPILSTCELGLDPDSGWRHRPRPLLGIDLPDYIPDLLALTWAIRSTLSPPLAPAGGAFVPWDKGGYADAQKPANGEVQRVGRVREQC